MSRDPQQPSDSSVGGKGPYLLDPVASRHFQESRGLIARAAEAANPERALVLGAGTCEEIPLAELVARFERVTLNDVHLRLLEQGIATAGLVLQDREKIDLHVADLTGITQPLVERIETALVARADSESAIECMAQLVDDQTSGGISLNGKYDLLVASCVLSQLHFDLTHRASDLFEQRFPGQLEVLRGAERWTTALYRIARRMEAKFVDDLVALVAAGGLVYLSESVRMCFIRLTASGLWQTGGTYRLLGSPDLADYVNRRFAIVERRRWEWVVAPPTTLDETGRLFDVQALVLRVP